MVGQSKRIYASVAQPDEQAQSPLPHVEAKQAGLLWQTKSTKPVLAQEQSNELSVLEMTIFALFPILHQDPE